MADIKLYGTVINGDGNQLVKSGSIEVTTAPGDSPANGSWYTLTEAISYIYANIGAINNSLNSINIALNSKTLVSL